MFKGNKNFIVGLFVSVSIAAFVAFVLWLTGRSGTEEISRYSMMFHRDVSGLSVGGPVNYMGVNVGSVISMQLIRQQDMKVRVDVDILESTPVDGGTFASLAFQGITGVAVVNLSSDPGHHESLQSGPGDDYPVIPVRDVGFAALMSSAPRIMQRLDDLLVQANKLLGEENQAAISGTLNDLQTLASSLAQSQETIASLPQDLSKTLTGIQATIEQLQGFIRNAEPGLSSTIDNINRSSENLASLTAGLDSWWSENENSMQSFIDDGLDEVPALINAAHKTMRELEKLLQELQDDPSQFIHRPRENSLEVDPR